MGKLYLPGTLVQDFKLVELAGDGTQSNVYLAVRDAVHYWLLQLEDKNFVPEIRSARVERFELDSDKDTRTEQFHVEAERWIAIPASGTTIVDLASWVDRLEVPFIGWRWALFARDVGLVNESGRPVQHTNALSLERLTFSEQGELIFAQARPEEQDAYVFVPPEGLAHITPAGDVYSLAASLKELLGKNIPLGIQQVLDRAMLPDPAKRYKNATVFGEELADVLPDPNRVKQPKPPVPMRSYARMGCIAGVTFILACCLFLVCSTLYTLSDPNFQRQLEQEYQRQLQQR